MTKIELINNILNEDDINLEEYENLLDKFKNGDILNTILSVYKQYLNSLRVEKIIPNYKLHNNILYLFNSLLEKKKTINDKKLLYIIYRCKIKIDNLVSELKKRDLFNEDNKIFISDLNSINNNIEIAIMNKIHDSYDNDKYEFINYVINIMKNKTFFDFSIAKFPYYINIKNNDGIHIIVEIINKYFNLIINNSEDTEILYYKNIINKFFNHPKFKIQDDEQKLINDMINHILDENELSAKDIFKIRDLQGSLYNNSIYNQKSVSELNIMYDKHFGFSKNVINTIPNIIKKSSDFEIKKEQKEFIVTIDGENTLDMDDAFSIEKLRNGNFLLKVYITDVASKVLYNTPIDLEALKRGSTIYLSNTYIPMLPTELSNDVLSLNSNNFKNVIAYIFEITNKGEVVNFKIKQECIKPNKRLSYDFVNRISESKVVDDKITAQVYYASYLAYILKNNNSIKNDYRYVEELKNSINGISLQGNEYKNRTKAEIIIEEFMLLVGREVSKLCLDNSYPLIYRNHDINEQSINSNIEELKRISKNIEESGKYMKLIESFIMQYPSSSYGLKNKGHAGLGYNSYTHITSPLRRYCDLMNQRLIKDCIINCDIKKYSQYEKNLEYIVNELNKTEKINYEYSKEYENITSKKYCKGKC